MPVHAEGIWVHISKCLSKSQPQLPVLGAQQWFKKQKKGREEKSILNINPPEKPEKTLRQPFYNMKLLPGEGKKEVLKP